MKKIIIIFAIILIIGIAAYFFFSGKNTSQTVQNQAGLVPVPVGGGNVEINVASSSNNNVANENVGNNTVTTSTSDAIGTASQILRGLPTGQTFTIGTSRGSVEVRNFYLLNPVVVEGGSVVLKQTQNYSIVYDYLDSSFWLAISGIPFTTWQPVAEQDFLNILNISKDDACKLNVSSGVYYDQQNPLSGKSFPLSFCNQTF